MLPLLFMHFCLVQSSQHKNQDLAFVVYYGNKQIRFHQYIFGRWQIMYTDLISEVAYKNTQF